MRPRFLLDEQLNPEIKKQLQIIEPSIEVYRIGERSVPPRGTLDPDILVWIEQHDFILVTNNRRSMAGHIDDHFAAGGHFPGILQIREGTTIGRIYLS